MFKCVCFCYHYYNFGDYQFYISIFTFKKNIYFKICSHEEQATLMLLSKLHNICKLMTALKCGSQKISKICSREENLAEGYSISDTMC